MKRTNTLLLQFSLIFSLVFSTSLHAATGTWASPVTGTSINYTVTEAATPLKDALSAYMTIVYLKNPGFDKIGGNTNEDDVNWLLSKGYRVIELDYAKNSKAVSPAINQDIIAINDAIEAGNFCGLTTCSHNRSWVLFEGYRIARDVSYFKDDPTVYNYPGLATYSVGDSLHMDIIYPANTTKKVPVVLSFSYSNSWNGTANRDQRLKLGYTLAMFNDSFLEGAPANGIAWAIADHPKYCDWGNGKPTGGANKALGSFEVNPDAAQKVKSAVRTLRKLGENLGLSGKIGIYGFSRGSDAGSLAVGDQSVPEFENAGLYQGVSDDVQVAALGSGVFDFTKIFVKTGDGDSNLESRCPVVWGPLASNVAAWRKQGSAYLAQSSATAPVIFFYNTDDAVYYQDQIGFFKARLDSLGVPTSVITNYGTGHAVPQTAVPLDTIYKFFSKYLISDVTSVNAPEVSDNHDFQMQVSCLKDQQSVKINFFLQQSSDVKIELINLSGNIISSKNQFYASGNQSEIFNSANLPQGIYLIKLSTENSGAAVKVAIN